MRQKARLNGFIAASGKRYMRSVGEREREMSAQGIQAGVGRPEFR